MLKKEGIIAIDGPAGAGKSTIAKIVAKRLGFLYIDTGAMYRAVTWKILQEKIPLNDIKKIIATAKKIDIQLKTLKNQLHTFVDGIDVSSEIRKEEISNLTNEVASIAEVREILRKKQRKLAMRGGVIMEGRDIGTCVFPDAKYKFYLDASVDERAKRRYKQLLQKGERVDLDKIKKAIIERDHKDKNRGINPLRQARDAIVIDSTHMTLKEVANTILDYVKKGKLKR